MYWVAASHYKFIELKIGTFLPPSHVELPILQASVFIMLFFFWCVPRSFILITVEHVTVVLVMPGQKKHLAFKSCAIQRSDGCADLWRFAVPGAVPVQVSCFNADGHLRLKGWPWSASCYCTKYTLEEKERLNLHLCLPLISQFATLYVLDRQALQQSWPAAVAHTVDKMCKMWQIKEQR